MAINWAEAATPFWAPRYHEELEAIGDLHRRRLMKINPMAVGEARRAFGLRAARQLDNLARCFKEAGMLATLESRR